jgi:hypothetical protein
MSVSNAYDVTKGRHPTEPVYLYLNSKLEFVIFNGVHMNANLLRRNVKILLPKTWTNVPNVAPIENESFETAEFR